MSEVYNQFSGRSLDRVQTLADGVCDRSDRALAWAVLGFLFFVTPLPFTASVLADHVHVPLAVVLYLLNLAALGIALAWLVQHARAHLLRPEHQSAMILVRRRLVLAQALYAVAALVTFASPVAAIVALAAVQVFSIVSPRLPVRV